MKKLSVITVTFNCEDLIKNTILSVLAQNANIVDYIVIDGGSVDGTVDIINNYKNRLAYFVSEPDGGIYDAMNKGINAASGDWILFLNAGDVFFEKFLLSNLKWDWPEGIEFVVFPFMIVGDKEPKFPILNAKFGMPTSHQAMLISSSAAKTTKLNCRYKVAADYDFYIKRLGLNRGSVYVERDILSKVLPGGYSKTHFGTMRTEYQRIIFDQLGLQKAMLYFLWSRPYVFKLIKSAMPGYFFNKIRKKFREI
jgi:glycosyltransferase involved in cell wall biosynthesis